MARSRLHKSFADYVAIAISPALIMVLVGSLVFFLQELGYSGEFGGRLKWILFWFVFAAVLIARISIEEGDRHAAVYTVAFWGAIALVVFRFLDKPLVGFALLGVTWWCAKKLTWDCTLIDDSQDASGQGLLQITGFDREDNGAAEKPEPEEGETHRQETTQEAPAENESEQQNAEAAQSQTEKPHAPGVWVVYFSLAALPLFGLGQEFLPANDAARRASAFQYLWVYVAAGLGLLLTTSFLGLRRYLRQRKLTMPASMTRGWIGMGAFLAVGILFVCLILPRPNAAYSFTKVVDTVSEKVGKASDYALGSDDAGEGEGRRAGREAKDDESQDGEGQQGNDGKNAGQTSKSDQPASGGKGKKEGQSESQGGKKGQKGEDKDGDKEEGDNDDKKKKDPSGGSGEAESQNKDGRSKDESGSQQPARVGGKIANIVKWLIYIAVGVALVIYVMRHWQTILAGLSRFWQDLKDLFAGLFGRKTADKARPAGGADNLPPDRPVRAFADYPNPFETGMEQNMGTNELIEYTYDALRAWGAERGIPKCPDQTPSEYVAELRLRAPELSQDARRVAELYLQAAFSLAPPSSKSRQALKKAWMSLERMPIHAS